MESKNILSNMLRSAAFTLAEVLIVLGILGVIAEMTIPTLITSVNDREIATQINEAYSMLSQATNKIRYEDNLDTTSATALRTSYGNALRFLVVGADENNTVATIFTPTYRYYKAASGPTLSDWTNNRVASLPNGSFISFFIESPTCIKSPSGGGTLSGYICAQIQIDVNGAKGPNMMGRDFVNFWLVKKDNVYRVYPMGQEGGRTCIPPGDNSTNNSGEGCTVYYINNTPLP